MATTDLSSNSARNDLDGDLEYRALSTSAIAALVLGLIGLVVFLGATRSLSDALSLAPLPLLAIGVGLRAWLHIRDSNNTLSGEKIALCGMVLGFFGLFGGIGYASYVQATEAREGYTRTSFAEFAPEVSELENGVLVPADIAALEGKQIFIKGYIRPDSITGKKARAFLLVRDSNECCFGDQNKVKYFDQMLVTMKPGQYTEFTRALFRVHGTLAVVPGNALRGAQYPVFSLVADYVE